MGEKATQTVWGLNTVLSTDTAIRKNQIWYLVKLVLKIRPSLQI